MRMNYSARLRQMTDAEVAAETNQKGVALDSAIASGHTNRWHVYNAGRNYLKALEEVERRKLTEATPASA